MLSAYAQRDSEACTLSLWDAFNGDSGRKCCFGGISRASGVEKIFQVWHKSAESGRIISGYSHNLLA